ncbi:hypothetical protein GCM10023328_15340 [Modestobacter marinus]|uniref:Uncharacterized protein n=1 Tax=Modestobacter marinus TaxID=477641 RepID=A0A846LRC6_9ACTN|nr:hypothetical protein [Modestobacter marinus]NIH68832.1 hypothetical protein [Modestobacter marinus]GGL60385.1 hypothetical protein GCM10011589_15530 [Modestobacter marinus]
MTEPDVPTAYVRDKRTPPPSREELRARIPGWGVDLDPADRPSSPKLQYPADTGAHWDFPDRQPGSAGRERSIEHAFVTPVFGTAQPLHGPSGAIRRLAYERFSEARLAHWLLLVAGDRVDAWGAHLASFASPRPDVPATGVRTELSHGGLRSRSGRSDRRHQLLDPVLVAGPWAVAAGVGGLAVRRLGRALRR